MTRALIADDEANLAEHLKARLQALWPELALLPLAANGHAKSGLVICFGMGATFRAMRSWGIDTTVVELSRSVTDQSVAVARALIPRRSGSVRSRWAIELPRC